MLINRVLFATFLANLVVALFVIARKETYTQVACMIPILFLLGGFKWYCMRTFDDSMHYYSKGSQKGREEGLPERKKRRDRVGVRFGHPALYKPLMTPMVHAKSQHLLREVYRGRLDADTDGAITGYGETYNMESMSKSRRGKSAGPNAPFELVNDSQLDFENFRNRPEFRDEFGGDGELYGRPSDLSRPGTPGTFDSSNGGSRPGSPAFWKDGPYGRGSQDSDRTIAEPEGATYPAGYHQPTPVVGSGAIQPPRPYSPLRRMSSEDLAGPTQTRNNNALYGTSDFSDVNLVGGAAPIAGQTTRAGGYNRLDASGAPEVVGDEETSYDFFRRGKRRD